MSNFQILPELDGNKVFLVNRRVLEGRLDAFFYKTDLRNIDAIVSERANKVLGGFALNITGGATPLKSMAEYYYTNEIDGIPLLRVQNITEEGLDFDNVIFINKHTHENYLSRSRVCGGDLLVTITGRIASSAVAPEGFDGNINQHSVVIKTENRNISEYLATFLNSNVGQKIAIKRTTGGTRPALDYSTLKNIPIVEHLPIVSIMKKAYVAKKHKEAEAQRLLDSIDGYLLGELGIELPEQEEGTLQSRIFTRQLREVSGGRLDPIYYSAKLDNFNSSIYDNLKLSAITVNIISGVGAGKHDQAIDTEGIIQIRPTNIDRYGLLKYDKNVYLPLDFSGDKIEVDSVLFNNTNSQELVGKTAILKENKQLFFSNHITKIIVDKNKVIPDYLMLIFNAYQANKVFYSICTNWNNQSGVGLDLLESLKVPVPPLEKQTEIVNHITGIRAQAKQLQQQAKAELEQAKKEVEAMILGKDESRV